MIHDLEGDDLFLTSRLSAYSQLEERLDPKRRGWQLVLMGHTVI